MNKQCEKYQKLIYLGVGNDLPSDIQADFEKHLRECKECRNKFDELIRIRNVFKDTQDNLSKLECSSNLSVIRENNIRSLKSKMKLRRKLQHAYILRPLAASFIILAISILILFFADDKHTFSDSSSKIKSPSAKVNNLSRTTESGSNNGEIAEIFKKNELDSNFYELTMKYPGIDSGHYHQGSSIRNISASSYVNTTNDVKVELDSEEGKRPVGLKPMKTKVECDLDDKNSEEFDF